MSGKKSEPAGECENIPPTPPAECLSAISLTDYWRNVDAGTDITPPGGYNCDLRDMNDNYSEVLCSCFPATSSSTASGTTTPVPTTTPLVP